MRWPWEGIYGIKNSYRGERGKIVITRSLLCGRLRFCYCGLFGCWGLGFQAVKSKTEL
jgi:hypothetical protein